MTTDNATETATVNLGALLEQAVRNKIRFATPKGQLSVEDLFDLDSSQASLNFLDGLAVALDDQLKSKAGKRTSFIKPEPTRADFTQLRMDIVLFVLNEKLARRDARLAAAAKAEQKQQLLAALDAAEKGELSKKSPDELRAMIAAL
jgi:hypothetical protein